MRCHKQNAKGLGASAASAVGAWSACGAWETRRVGNAARGKCGAWETQRVGNAVRGKHALCFTRRSVASGHVRRPPRFVRCGSS